MALAEKLHIYFNKATVYRRKLYMKPLLRILLLAFFSAVPFCAMAQQPQQTNAPEVKHFPNPAGNNGVVNIIISIPSTSFVNLKLFNPLGIQLKELVNGTLAAGEHNIPVDISTINDGVYFYTLRVNDHSETKKLTVKK